MANITEEDKWGKYFDGTSSAVVQDFDDEKFAKYFDTDSSRSIEETDESKFAKYFDGVSADDAGYTSDLRFSQASFKQRQGRGFGELADYYTKKTGLQVPGFLTNFFQQLEETGDEEVKGYVPDYPGPVTKADSVPGWTFESIKQQAHEQGIIYGGAFIAQRLIALGNPWAMGAGALVASGTAAITFNTIHDEVLQELAHLNGKKVSELSDKERDTAYWKAIQNTVLEFLPIGTIGRGKKAFKSASKDIKSFAKDMEKWLKNADKEKILKQGKTFLKNSVKLSLGEGATETAAQLNIQAASDPGIEHAKTEEGKGQLLSALAGGMGGGPVYGSPQSISDARSFNKTIKEGTNLLESLNTNERLKSGSDYETALNLGPQPEGFDIELELYDVPERSKGPIKRFGDLLISKGLGRSVNEFKSALNKTKTGRDVHDLHTEIFGAFTGTETMSGETQGKTSFHDLKHQYLDTFAQRFLDIQSKWSKKIPFMGEMGERPVAPEIDAYFGASLENRVTKVEEKALRKLLSRKDVKELKKDINEVKSIRDKVYKDLSSVLKDSDVSLGYTEGYLTRGIDHKAVKKYKQDFIESLVNDVEVVPEGVKEEDVTLEMRQEEAERIANDIINGKNLTILTSKQIREDKKRSGQGRKYFEKSRNKNWDALDSKFRNSSAFNSMQDYLTAASVRAASTKTFGGNNAERFSSAIDRLTKKGVLSKQGAQTAWDMYDAEHNVYNRPETDDRRIWQSVSKGLSTFTAINLLGLATLASLTEPMWIPGRVGYMNMLKALPTVAGYALKGMKRTIYGGKRGKEIDKSFGRSLLNVMGQATNPKVNEKIEMMMAGDYNPHLSLFFRSPGGLFLTQYTNAVRTWTAAAGLKMIQGQANKVNRLKGVKLSGLQRELRENGMTVGDFKQMVRLNKGKVDILNDKWLDTRFTKENGTSVSVRDMLVPWLRKITTDVALEPQVGNRPLWMSNPDLQLLAQLKSFPILFSNTIAKRTMKTLNPKACTPAIVGSMNSLISTAMALAMATMVVEMKKEIRGSDKETTPLDVVGAVGVPYVTAQRPGDLIVPAAVSTIDGFSKWFMSIFDADDDETMEDVIKVITKALAGTIFAEQLDK